MVDTDKMTNQPRLRRRALLTAAAVVPPVAVAARFVSATAADDQTGSWSAPFDLGGVAIHATLLHNDDILWFQDVEGTAGVDYTSSSDVELAHRRVQAWPRCRTTATSSAPSTTSCPTDGCSSTADMTHDRGQTGRGRGRATPTSTTRSPASGPTPLGWPRSVGIRPAWVLPNGRTLIFGGNEPGVLSKTVEEYNAGHQHDADAAFERHQVRGPVSADAPDGQRPDLQERYRPRDHRVQPCDQ